jgi:HD-GYP domain-containing protein (c-di-GMP phosphodiesterase class II)
MKTYPLRVFVKRVLLIRLGVATVAIALLIGGITYFVQQDRLERQVVDIGREGISALTRRVMALIQDQKAELLDALHQAIVAGAESPATFRTGHFVFVQFYNRAGNVFAEESASGHGIVDPATALMVTRPFSFPEAGQAEAETRRTGDGLLVISAMPLTDHQGGVRGYVRGVFAVSAETTAEMRGAVLRSVVMMVAIVFGVTAILYPVILHLTRRLADYSTSLLDANLETLAVLGSAIAKRDADTDAHNYRVSLYSARLGESIGLGTAEMRELIKGSFIHDVGKIGIPDAILLKPGRLDEEEYRDSVPVVAGHHEKFSGGGYPLGARAEEIPLTARIFAIADVFDALTSERPYKKPLGFEDTMKILQQGRGEHFDPALLDAFTAIARNLHGKYARHEGDDLRQELVAVVDKYFSSGIETLLYAGDGITPTDDSGLKRGGRW